MENRLHLHAHAQLSQSLAPHLRLVIKLLQMGQTELQSFVDQAVLENPFLSTEDTRPEEETHENSQTSSLPKPEFISLASRDFTQESKPRAHSELMQPLEDTLPAAAQTLRDHLITQLAIHLESKDLRLAHAMIDELNDAGFFCGDMQKIADEHQISQEHIETILQHIQSCDPTGIGARNLGECFRLQLIERGELSATDDKILEQLALLVSYPPETLAKKLGVSSEDLKNCLKKIRKLNPRPAENFHTVPHTHDRPDVLLCQGLHNGAAAGLQVILNPDAMPRLLIDQTYFTTLKQQCHRAEDFKYLDERFQNARGLLKALHQRASTILKVATAIIEKQLAFFQFGTSGLQPLTLRDIAAVTGLHESTISRVTSHKSILTPRGHFPLKYFFSSSVDSTFHDHGVAAGHVKALIHDFIHKESLIKPLSDDQLTHLLKTHGIQIARRTVAKYRESLGLSSSSERKKAHAIEHLVAPSGQKILLRAQV